ncbi:MAG: intA [Gammaproteobacteria bacterium]|jgi:integrase|nr:intA [Gammaproteobacteria bacterium]
MTINKLNSKSCNNAPAGTHFDGEGLYLLVKPDGKKYWRMACYLHGKRKLLAFGTYPKVSLAEAREERIQAQKLLNQGIDPVQHSKAQKLEQAKALEQAAIESGNTFEQIARRLYAHKAGKTTEDYRNLMIRQLEIHVFPEIGKKHITEITGAELISLFKAVAQKTNHGRPMTYMARKLCNWSSEVFDLASAENNNFTNNPCRVIIRHLPTHSTQHMARISFEQLPEFIKSLKSYKGYPLTKAAIWMLLYTGMRQASIRKAVWQDFDLENALWNRQPEKSDKSVHILPLPHQAVTLLKEIMPLTGGRPADLVFPSIYSKYRPMSEAAICQALSRMNYKMVGHGLRSVVSTGLNELGFKPHVVEVQIGHKKESSIEGAYNHAKHFQERREMMQEWADYLDKQ